VPNLNGRRPLVQGVDWVTALLACSAVSPTRPSSATAIDLTHAIATLRARLRQESQPAPSEISMPQLHALSRIAAEGPISNATLAAREHVRPQSMNEWVRMLQSRGLVARSTDAADARKILFTVTAEGRRTLDAIIDVRHAWLAAAIDEVLSPAEQQILDVAVDLIERVAASGDEL
jgi:DNA-binding MarR family transcriptional regulator